MPLSPEQTDTYYIFLASPGDMGEERQAVRDFFERYNHDIARHRRLRFMVVDYENYADIGIGRPQEIINRQTLERYKDHLALVVGLMGQRFGSPSGKAESGTEEEFALALEFRQAHGWLEIKWFFREQANPSFLPKDSRGMRQAAEQMAKVEAFRQRLEQGKPQFLYKTFPTTADFPDCFEPDLQNWLNVPQRLWNRAADFPPTSPMPETDEGDGPWFDSYLSLLAADCNRLPLNLLKAEEFEAALEELFVPLDVVRPPNRTEPDVAEIEHLARTMARGEGDERKPVFETLGENRTLVLVGDPGSGKSTLVNRLTQRLLAGEEKGSVFDGLLPVRIILRRVDLPANTQADAGCVWRALVADIVDRLKLLDALDGKNLVHEAQRICRRIKARAKQAPGLLLMLDGLDEVSEAGDRRHHLLQAVQLMIEGLPHHNRFLVTARPYAYADAKHRLKDVPYSVLAPFDKDQLARFMRNWHQVERGAKGLSEADAETRADHLIRRLESRPDVRRLDLLDYLRRHAGILISREEERFAFPHRAFQEYLAMRHLDAHVDDSLVRTTTADPLWWREVFRLAVAAQRKSPRNGIFLVLDLLDRIDGTPPELGHRTAVLCGLALLELDLDPEHRAAPTHHATRKHLVALIEDPNALDTKERLEAGLTLGRLGDPRAGVGLDSAGLPDIQWVKIPAGEFIYQDGQRRTLEAFHIARHPVTNEQFQTFLEAPEGHDNKQWWSGFESVYKEPEGPRWDQGNCPRETVDWYQALAFCRWLSARRGYEIRLPTEVEWERAARYTDGRGYPWEGGFDRHKADVAEEWGGGGPNDLGRTSPVGTYPLGRSREGVDDLAGNVWEWCLNKYDKPEVIAVDTSGDERVARGGSWLYDPGLARSAVRLRLHPGNRNINQGFRVLCAAPIRSEH